MCKDFSIASDFTLDFPKDLAWYEQAELTGYTFKQKEDSWLLVVRASVGGTPQVAFFQTNTVLNCYRALWSAIHTRKPFPWKKDKFAS